MKGLALSLTIKEQVTSRGYVTNDLSKISGKMVDNLVYLVSNTLDQTYYQKKLQVFRRGKSYKTYYFSEDFNQIAIQIDDISFNKTKRVSRIFISYDPDLQTQGIEIITHDLLST